MLDVEDLLAPRTATPGAAPLLLALDGVEDPQNLGALLRTADGAGVTGVLLTERRSAPLSAVALKASAGAAEHVRIARVVNLVRALEQVKAANIWCVGLDERGTMDYTEYDFTSPCLLVLGREGAGLHDLVRRTCDHLLRIPMAGKVASLNVSAAGAVVLYEAYRQRRQGPLQTTEKERATPEAAQRTGILMPFRHAIRAFAGVDGGCCSGDCAAGQRGGEQRRTDAPHRRRYRRQSSKCRRRRGARSCSRSMRWTCGWRRATRRCMHAPS